MGLRIVLILVLLARFSHRAQPTHFGTEYATRNAGSLIQAAEDYLARIRANTDATTEKNANESAYRTEGTVLPIGSFQAIETTDGDAETQQRREAIKDAVRHAWDGYAKAAWGYDELRPVTHTGTDSFSRGLGTTIIDSLSTLYIMGGLEGRYEQARDWVDKELDFGRVGQVIVFETVIRVLGGLVSMYHLSGDALYARRAEELGARLAASFESPTGYPWPRAHLNDSRARAGHDMQGDSAYLAEVGSVQLELRALAHFSREPLLHRLRAHSESIIAQLQTAESSATRMPTQWRAMLPFSLSIVSGRYSTNMVTLGAPADSYFEYLVKCWIQGGQRETGFWRLFAEVMDGMTKVASYRSRFGDVIVRDVFPEDNGTKLRFQHKMDHFACYIPGMIVLGIDGLPLDDSERRSTWAIIAEELTETCYRMYQRSPTGLAGENIRLSHDDKWHMNGGYNLRPEAVEAFFYMWRFTKRKKYRDYAWEVFQNIQTHCKIDKGGYAAIKNAKSRNPKKDDIMHSFLIAETFKYLYLIFGPDDELPLDKWVFNTEAHPLLITPTLVETKSHPQCQATNHQSDECATTGRSILRDEL